MIAQIKTAFRFWGVILSVCFGIVIISQLMIIVAIAGEMLSW
ncbi:hypothetical protein beppo_4 [Salmonella phage beppo]|uniref:Uncharacterized protein n=1 Tax=Salmonella phage beppo TaxID=2713280 RepID=A0A6G8RFD6_9CAUD|nr:hypothetical protein beppo_4 [Salmonella phage beppo]